MIENPENKADRSCDIDCALQYTCNNPNVPMEIVGNDPKVLFIGEAPGAEEDLRHRPFVGNSGKLLRKAIMQAGINDFALTNVVKCRPPNNRNPNMSEVKKCLPKVYEDIKRLPNLKVIVLVGAIALRGLTGLMSITKLSGTILNKPINVDGRSIPALALMHPAYVLRNPNEARSFTNHVFRISSAINDTLTDESDVGDYFVIETIEQFEDLVNHIKEVREFAYDVETTGLNLFYLYTGIKCIQFSIHPREAYVLPIHPWDDVQWGRIYPMLVEVFEDQSIRKIGHNIKFDNLALRECLGINVQGTYWDTEVSQYILDESSPRGLKELAWRYSKLGGYEHKLSVPVQEAEGDELYLYGAIDVDLTNRIKVAHSKELKENPENSKLNKVFHELYMPSIELLAEMEHNGMLINPDAVASCKSAIADTIEGLRGKILNEDPVKQFAKESGLEVNINSTVQLREILFKYANLPVVKRTDKTDAPSTDKSVLAELSSQSRLCRLLLEYSRYNTLTKFADNLLKFADSNHVVHTQYHLVTTTSGRTSSSDPNLQNIPKGERDSVGLRKCFIARPGYVLAEFDYNQHELRVMAEAADDDALRKALATDIHSETASIIFNKPPSEINEDERKQAKIINFGIIYCMTAWGISQRLKCSEEEANKYLERILGRYHGINRYMERIRRMVIEKHYVETLTGLRRRYTLPDPTLIPVSEYNQEISSIFREAINMPIQGTAGHILLLGGIGVLEMLRECRAKSYLSWEVHDSIGLQIHKDEMDLIPEIKHILKTRFLKYMPNFKTPLEVDVKIGENWGEMEDYV